MYIPCVFMHKFSRADQSFQWRTLSGHVDKIFSTLCIIQLLENSRDYHSCHYMSQKVCWCICLHKGMLGYVFVSASTHVSMYIYESVWVWLNVMQWTNSVQWRVYFCNPIHKLRNRHNKRWSNRDKLCS